MKPRLMSPFPCYPVSPLWLKSSSFSPVTPTCPCRGGPPNYPHWTYQVSNLTHPEQNSQEQFCGNLASGLTDADLLLLSHRGPSPHTPQFKCSTLHLYIHLQIYRCIYICVWLKDHINLSLSKQMIELLHSSARHCPLPDFVLSDIHPHSKTWFYLLNNILLTTTHITNLNC